jgi:hypothetical protein
MGVPRRQFGNGERSLDSRTARSDGRSLDVGFDRHRDRDIEAGDSKPRRYLGNPRLVLGLTDGFPVAYFGDVGWQSALR